MASSACAACLGVNRSSYYKSLDGAEARLVHEQLAAQIRAVHADTDGACGSPRVTTELREAGMVVNEQKVARVMREFSIAGIHLHKKARTHARRRTNRRRVPRIPQSPSTTSPWSHQRVAVPGYSMQPSRDFLALPINAPFVADVIVPSTA